MKDELIINGKKYVHTPEPVKVNPRIEGYVNRALFRYFKSGDIHEVSSREINTRMVEIRDNEVIVSEDDVRKAVRGKCHGDNEEIIIKSLFKKDGV